MPSGAASAALNIEIGAVLAHYTSIISKNTLGDLVTTGDGTAPVQYERRGAQVQSMFRSIAARYDRANTILSFGIHHLWRRTLLSQLPTGGSVALDLCTGTADLVPALAKRFKRVVGADFCAEMLDVGRVKLRQRGTANAELVVADALNLPFADNTFDCVTVAFGVRNFENLERGLSEIRRVLRPGGSIAVVEFGQPGGVFGLVYRYYSRWVLPILGGLITGDRAAYTYLERTSSKFPCGVSFLATLRDGGFVSTEATSMTFGLAYVYRGRKS